MKLLIGHYRFYRFPKIQLNLCGKYFLQNSRFLKNLNSYNDLTNFTWGMYYGCCLLFLASSFIHWSLEIVKQKSELFFIVRAKRIIFSKILQVDFQSPRTCCCWTYELCLKIATVVCNWDETLVNKPYVNEVTLRGQKPPLKYC